MQRRGNKGKGYGNGEEEGEAKMKEERRERGGRRCNTEGGEQEAQTVRCKISYKDVLDNVGNMANIL